MHVDPAAFDPAAIDPEIREVDDEQAAMYAVPPLSEQAVAARRIFIGLIVLAAVCNGRRRQRDQRWRASGSTSRR